MARVFFATAAGWRAWLERHHAAAREVVVGFHKRGSGKPSISWPESVDEALCFGWIDGVRRNVDATTYEIRFTPRRPKSIWSKVNIDKVKALTAAGRMAPAGLKAFAARDEARSRVYSYEQVKAARLDAAAAAALRASRKAWAFWQSLPPSYQSQVAYWLASAKKEETRRKRLAEALASFERGERLRQHRFGKKA